MPIAWTESLTLKLVTLYSEHECLINPFHPNFKNKLCRYKAYKEITDSMNVCGLTVCDCIKRITYVKSQYCHELSKISAAISCENFYKPTASWFPLIHKLFFPFITTCSHTDDLCKIRDDKTSTPRNYHCNETRNQLTRLNLVVPEVLSRDCDCPYATCYCHKSYKTKPHIRLKQLGTQFSTQGEKIITSQTTAAEYTNYLHLRSQKVTGNDVGSNTKRYIYKEHTTQTDVSCFKTTCTSCQVCFGREIPFNASSMMKNDLNTSSDYVPAEENTKGKSKTDEFDMFGKSIAFQLRNINFEIAIKLEKRIQDLIVQERLYNMKSKCSDCCTSTSSCSECKDMHKGMVCSCGLPLIMIKTYPSCDFDCKQRT
ncbi:unnamed protein product [Xylocopa violacea]|uniref:MADF domain-containing protein n=1 Tax=Xylocopa violacea TaxID=135666 RepID=A0ABP1NH54_XYLVO